MRTDLWTICDWGHLHWGHAGGAGFLFRYVPPEGEPVFLLLRRSASVDEGGKWGVPGGATRHGESPEATARRETIEEIGRLPSYRITSIDIQDCGGNWKFHLIMADVDQPFEALCGQETEATGWFTKSEMAELTLHPGVEMWLRDRH